MPTIKDVAKEAGVSIATVSYVLNNKRTFFSEGTRQQVLEAVERIGYTPNVTARNLKASQTRLIGYAWHEVPFGQVNSVLDHFTYWLAQAAEAAGYHILTFTHPLYDAVPVYEDLIKSQRVDGFVLAGTIANDERIRYLMEADFPFVSFGRSNPDWDFPWVDTDGQRGVYEAVNYLIDLGHRRIAIAAWPEESISGSFRLAGYIEALQEAAMPLRPDFILRGIHSEQFGREALAYWHQLPEEERPTAVITISDLIAIGVMNEARQRGLVIGDTLSVIGFDDAPMGQYLTPALTTVRQPIGEIGQALVTMLEIILGKRTPVERAILTAPRLIVRESCGPAPR